MAERGTVGTCEVSCSIAGLMMPLFGRINARKNMLNVCGKSQTTDGTDNTDKRKGVTQAGFVGTRD
jgi:hypothetical protein